MKRVAVVLLNFNGLELLKKFLEGTILYSPQADFVLIDNCSTDNSVSWFKSKYPNLLCIQLDKNYGYAGGYNKGLKHIKNEYYALLNTDLIVTKNWLNPIIKKLETNNNIGVIQPHILDFNNKKYFEYAGAAGGYIDKYGFPYCRGRIFRTVEVDKGQYNLPKEIFWASGACFVIKSKIFWELNGFDSDFFAHQEEIDLCWRIFNKNYKIYAIGDSKVYHIGGYTLPISPKKTYFNHRNSLFMLMKNLPNKNKFIILITRLLIDCVIMLYYLFSLKLLNVVAILRAHIAFYASFKRFASKEVKVNKKSNYFKHKSILYAYLATERAYFGDLKHKN